MTDDADLMTDLDSEGTFEVQMRGYSRRQVDEFVARSRTIRVHPTRSRERQ